MLNAEHALKSYELFLNNNTFQQFKEMKHFLNDKNEGMNERKGKCHIHIEL